MVIIATAHRFAPRSVISGSCVSACVLFWVKLQNYSGMILMTIFNSPPPHFEIHKQSNSNAIASAFLIDNNFVPYQMRE